MATTVSELDSHITQIEEGYRKTGVVPSFTPDGNLVYLPTYKSAEVQVKLQQYGPATVDEIQAYYRQRREEIGPLQDAVIEAKKSLQEVMNLYKAGGNATAADVVSANKAVQEAECRLNVVRKFPRYLTVLPTAEGNSYALLKRDLTFDIYQKDPPNQGIYKVEYGQFTWKPQWKPVAYTPASNSEKIDLEADVFGDEEDETESESKQEGGAEKPKRQLTAQQKAIIGYRMRRTGGH